jgi:hypothetical protein
MGRCERLCPVEQVLQNRPYNQRIELPSTFDEEGRPTPHAPRTLTHMSVYAILVLGGLIVSNTRHHAHELSQPGPCWLDCGLSR